MSEKTFVDGLIRTIKKFGQGFAFRPNDNMTIGMPDVLGYVPLGDHQPGFRGPPKVWAIAIEAKALHKLMEDPYHKGRRVGQMLRHPFSGPQVSTLRKMAIAGVDAFGLIMVSEDTAFRFHPNDISTRTGNFTHEELVEFGVEVRRDKGIWNFWGESYGQISSPRHRNNPRD